MKIIKFIAKCQYLSNKKVSEKCIFLHSILVARHLIKLFEAGLCSNLFLIKSSEAAGTGRCQLKTIFCGGADPAKVTEPIFSKDCRSSKFLS